MVRVRVRLGYTMAICLVLQHQVSPQLSGLEVEGNHSSAILAGLPYLRPSTFSQSAHSVAGLFFQSPGSSLS